MPACRCPVLRPATYLPVTHGISVVDGDTIRIDGRLTRLTGFNAPETWKPNCAAERRLGEAATARLRQLVDGGDGKLRRLCTAPAPGTEGTADCNYGRACGSLRVDGRDVGHDPDRGGPCRPLRLRRQRLPAVAAAVVRMSGAVARRRRKAGDPGRTSNLRPTA